MIETMFRPTFIRKTYPAKTPHRVIFFFTGFKGKSWHYKPAYKTLNKLGYDVFSYEFPAQAIIDGSIDYYAEILDNLLVDIHHKIQDYSSRGITEFATFGVSMGSIYSSAVAKRTLEIGKMVFVTAYGSGALEIWEYPPMQKLASYKSYSEENLTVEQAAKRYPMFEAAVDAEKLAGKKLLLYASRDDKVIRLHNTQIFIDRARELGLDLEVIIGRRSHLRFITATIMRGKRWKSFLQ